MMDKTFNKAALAVKQMRNALSVIEGIQIPDGDYRVHGRG